MKIHPCVSLIHLHFPLFSESQLHPLAEDTFYVIVRVTTVIRTMVVGGAALGSGIFFMTGVSWPSDDCFRTTTCSLLTIKSLANFNFLWMLQSDH